MTDEKEFEAANARATAQLEKTPKAVAARYDKRLSTVVIELSTGLSIMFKPRDVQGLENARPEALARIEISPSGLGLYFPALDADLYLPGLLAGFMGSRTWMASHMGKTGGSSTSTAKQQASRANGKLGGRPKKPRATDAA